jgi:hypothetical protein
MTISFSKSSLIYHFSYKKIFHYTFVAEIELGS